MRCDMPLVPDDVAGVDGVVIGVPVADGAIVPVPADPPGAVEDWAIAVPAIAQSASASSGRRNVGMFVMVYLLDQKIRCGMRNCMSFDWRLRAGERFAATS